MQRHMSSAHCIVDYDFGWDVSLLICGMWGLKEKLGKIKVKLSLCMP